MPSACLPRFSQIEENACVYVSIKARETTSNTAITLFVSTNPCLILVKKTSSSPGPIALLALLPVSAEQQRR